MTSLRLHLQAFACALQFLTLIPVRTPQQPDRRLQALAMLYYPAVGLVIGALLCLAAVSSTGLPLELRATLVLLLWCVLTGGLHLDGLADSADGWMGGLGDRERTLAIMKDPHIGATGVIALLLQLLLKWSLLLALLPQNDWWALLFAPVAARAAALLLFAHTPYVRRGGIAGEMLAELSDTAIYVLVAAVGLLLLLIHPLWLLVPGLVYGLARMAMMRRLQGCTGDTAGALIELSESALLFAAVPAYLAIGGALG